MIGTVLEGRHAGCAVHRLSEQNLLYIQAKDGTQVALSKKNVITIDDVTDRYPDYGKKVIMVMWEDFETSLIRLGAPRKEPAVPAPAAEQAPEPAPVKKKRTGKIVVIVLVILLLLLGCAAGVLYYLSLQPAEKTAAHTASINRMAMEGQLTATYEKGIPNGPGSFTYSDGSISVSYTGQWADGVLSGNGTLEYVGMEVSLGGKTYTGTYSGEAFEGIPQGNGTFTAGSEAVYTGLWQDGVPCGQGHLEAEGISVEYMGMTHTGKYKGDVLDGIPQGDGEFSAKDAQNYLTYSGVWEAGQITGPGKVDTSCYTVVFDDVTRTGSYSGDLVKGLADGEGIFTTRNSDNELYTYTGQWKYGQWNGQGLWEFPESDAYTYEGTFTNCEYTPNLAEFFRFFGTRPEHEYTMSHKAWKTLSLYPEVFLENNAAGSALPVDYYFNYDAFAKNPNNYGDSLISVSGLRVVQIFEYEDYGYNYTFLILEDYSASKVYYTRIMGYWDNIYEGSYVTLTALPLDYFTYPNVSGTSIWAIACAGVRIN